MKQLLLKFGSNDSGSGNDWLPMTPLIEAHLQIQDLMSNLPPFVHLGVGLKGDIVDPA